MSCHKAQGAFLGVGGWGGEREGDVLLSLPLSEHI